jgi:hypothetical protein
MTPKKFIIFFVLQLVLFIFIKVWLFNNLILENPFSQNLFFWALVCFVTTALIRRFGVITYFEAFTIITVWVLVDAFFDLIITSSFTGLGLFAQWSYWVGYLVMLISIVFFHKKRHIHLRKELHAKHHAHGGYH